FFDYVDEERRPPLLNKHLLLTTADKNYEKQKSFDRRLSKLLDYKPSIEVVMNRLVFNNALISKGKYIIGYRFFNA
ncbi:hypothetical protein CGI70_22435, partial [Vibrio parahaemolyticus]